MEWIMPRRAKREAVTKIHTVAVDGMKAALAGRVFVSAEQVYAALVMNTVASHCERY
jgi:hypothetical protein